MMNTLVHGEEEKALPYGGISAHKEGMVGGPPGTSHRDPHLTDVEITGESIMRNGAFP